MMLELLADAAGRTRPAGRRKVPTTSTFLVLDELAHLSRTPGRRRRRACAPRARPALPLETPDLHWNVGNNVERGERGDRAASVAAVATRLFGAQIGADAVIDEVLSVRRTQLCELTVLAPRFQHQSMRMFRAPLTMKCFGATRSPCGSNCVWDLSTNKANQTTANLLG